MTAVTGPIPQTRPDLDPSEPYGELASAAGWAQKRLGRTTGPLPATSAEQSAALRGSRDTERLRPTNPVLVLSEAQAALEPGAREWATGTTVLGQVRDGLRHLDGAPATAPLRAAGGQHRKPGAPRRRPTRGRHRNQAKALCDDPVVMLRARALAALGIPGWCPGCGEQPCGFHMAMEQRAITMFATARRIDAGHEDGEIAEDGAGEDEGTGEAGSSG